MKTLLIAVLVLGTVFVKAANASDCSVTLRAKTATAKGAKLDGVSFSEKQISALKTICTVNVELMGREELIADYTKALDRKLEKNASKK